MAPTLSTVDPGTSFEIEQIPDGTTRARLLRLGFLDGPVQCQRCVRNGPVIVRRNGTDLAIGAPVAEEIAVTPVDQ